MRNPGLYRLMFSSDADKAAASWAQVHGLAMLASSGQLFEEKVGPELVRAALDILLGGLCLKN